MACSGRRSTPPLMGSVVQTIQRGENMLPEKQKAAYKAFYESARKNDILEEKTTLLIHLAAAFAIGCYP